MSLGLFAVVVASAIWAIRVRRHLMPVEAARDRLTPRFDAAFGILLGAALWWAYMRFTDPSVHTPADLLRATYTIYSGGATIAGTRYVMFLLSVACLALSFAFAGHALCRQTGFLGVASFVPIDLGVYYFVGMATFLSLLVLFARLTKHAFLSAAAILIVFGAISVWTLGARDIRARIRAGIRPAAVRMGMLLPLLVGALCLLQWIVMRRAGPSYELIADYIAQTDQLPLINRHFGQSLLASLGLMVFGTGTGKSTFARVLVNNWLFVSQLGMILVLFRFLRELSVSRSASAIGVVILMLGGSALSLLPYIMYDHDYPLIMNIYADSVFGIAGFLIIVLYLLHLARWGGEARGPWWREPAVVPGVIMMAFNFTAELNVLMAFLALGVFGVVNAFRQLVTWPRLALIAVVWAAAALAGARGGGVFSAAFASENAKQNSPFFESSPAGARMNAWQADWWYLPFLIVNFDNGFGNLPVPTVLLARGPAVDPAVEASEAYSRSSNGKLIARFARNRAAWSSYSNLIFIAELRTMQAIRALWFPLIGVAGLWLSLRASTSHPTREGTTSERERLWLFWIIAATAFASGVAIVIFINAIGGNGVYWKWALTRFLEPGLCLATVALVVLLDRATRAWESPLRRRATWLAVALLMSFGPLYRILCFDF